jgi:AcrR family transcriptional regulator
MSDVTSATHSAPPRGPRADAERNRRLIVDTALGLFRVNRAVTIDDVVEASGLSRTTVFRHFRRRDELLLAVCLEVSTTVEERLDAAPLESLDPLTALKFLTHTAVELADQFGVVLSVQLDLEVFPEVWVRFESLHERCRLVCERAQQSGLLRSDVSSQWLAAVYYGLVQALFDCLVRGTVTATGADELLFNQFVQGAAGPSA